MKKIPTLFQRDPDDRAHVLPEVNPGCEWVLEGFGTATRKYDGTCVMLDDLGKWWARREVKPGKTPPASYVPVTTDEVTGKTMGWEPIGQSAFAKFHAEALANHPDTDGPRAGTYELVGPKVNGNPEREQRHRLIEHATAERLAVPELTFDGIRKTALAAAEADGCEGLVWHHPDGRMVKIKARDFHQT
ncbi:hypothetical protein DN069_14165 [Streptacidiphilus pinicola]|uniref:Uncharacterized protein n=1 Tax=Streptacidiphilus pinicola TaxID=2219663 RepID=A0A2X0IIW1_9ACTN|nr:DUF5565 family protein [Streptacidiphilus pinicola]RAG84962.1 hypothetical protein DN069_14165 [Streptacidiphilus pinicola]